MPRNGQGVYTPPTNSFNPAVTGQDALPDDWNATLADLSGAISRSIDSGGTTTITANLPMNGKVLTGLGAGTAATHSVNLGQAQSGAFSYATASGTDTYTATLSPAPASYVSGAAYRILIPNANTVTNPTLNLNSLGAKDIVSLDGSAPDVGMIKAALYTFVYDGTSFRVSAVDYGGVAFLDADNNFTQTQKITSTDAGAAEGPQLILDRESASPAADDLIGFVPFAGRNSTGEVVGYGKVGARIKGTTDGSEDGEVFLSALVAGVETERVTATAAGAKITGAGTVTGSLSVGDDLTVTDNTAIGGDATVGGALGVTGALTAASVNGIANPAPIPAGIGVLGQWNVFNPGVNPTTIGSPGQTWAYFYVNGSSSSGGVVAGGSTVATPNFGAPMLTWRIA